MKNSHAAISTRKGFNYGVWFGLLSIKKQGKQELLHHYRIIKNIADQKPYRSGHCSALPNVEHEQT